MPEYWKRSHVKPIFKSGTKSDIKNYRPICILSSIPKLLEKIVTEFCSAKLKNCFVSQQHGFVKGKSTSTNLLIYENYITKAFDFSKAFYSVDHLLLLNKIHRFGIVGPLWHWLRFYLSNRCQIVKINDCYSDQFPVSSGVPQGSHLGPMLFNIFINDISECFQHSEVLMFADDLKVFKKIETRLDSNLLQSDLDHLHTWCVENRLMLNPAKCKVIIFSKSRKLIDRSYNISDAQLERVNVIKDLGVHFDSSLTFREHINHVCCISYKMLGFLKRHTQSFKNVMCIKYLYTALVRSNLEYCSIVWSPFQANLINAIESVQSKFLRYVATKLEFPIPENVSVSSFVGDYLDLQTLSARRDMFKCLFAFKLINNQISCSELLQELFLYVPPKRLRNQMTFCNRICRTNYLYHSALNSICNSVNCQSFDIFVCSEKTLKCI